MLNQLAKSGLSSFNPLTALPSFLPVLTWGEHGSKISALKASYNTNIKCKELCKNMWESEQQYMSDIDSGSKQADGTVVYKSLVIKPDGTPCIIIYYIPKEEPLDWRKLIENLPIYSQEEISSKILQLKQQYGEIKIEEYSIIDVWRNLFSPAVVPEGYTYLATYIQEPSLLTLMIPRVIYAFGRTGGNLSPYRGLSIPKWVPLTLIGIIGAGIVYIVIKRRRGA